MSNESIMLAKTYKSHKDLHFPVAVYEKLDGVPVRLSRSANEKYGIGAITRQNDPVHSIDHIRKQLYGMLPVGANLVGELYIPELPFKDISGLVRRKSTTEKTEQLRLYIHDFFWDNENTPYSIRMQDAIEHVYGISDLIKFIPGLHIDNAKTFDKAVDKFKKDYPESEGLIIRALDGPTSYYKTGWRSPGLLKMKWQETIDLPLYNVEEAQDKDGNPLGMAGRLIVEYKGKQIGVGPGKLTHAERKDLWDNFEDYAGDMMEIAYMPDKSYGALREARFHRWRPDKD